MNKLSIGGTFKLECFNASGELKWSEQLKNGVANAAINSLLDVYFRGSAQITSWYIGLIDSVSFTALAASDTMASHGGWIEATSYTQAARPAWAPGAASSQLLVNAATVDFTINTTKTIRGVFIASDSTKGGTSGILFCTALPSEGDRAVVNTDTLKVTYTLSAQSG